MEHPTQSRGDTGMAPENLLWVDKHRPGTFSRLTYHHELTRRLEHLTSNADMPHLLFYGPSGSGKRTRVGCALRQLFGPSVEKKRVMHRVFKVGDTSKQIEVTTVASAHHVEVNPSESGINDRLVVQELIKDIASSAPVDVTGVGSSSAVGPGTGFGTGTTGKQSAIKVIVLHQVDSMSRLAQQALRRTMERYALTCRVILVTDTVTKVIQPLRSRCLGIRVPSPSGEDVKRVLQFVADREGITVPDELADKFVQTSGRNMRRALLQLEATRVSIGSLTLPADASIMLGDWEYACQDAATLLTRQQSASQLMLVRKRFQDMLSHAIPPDVILRHLLSEILRIADDEIAPAICSVAAKFDSNLTNGSKPIFHLEAFAARFMQVYAQFLQTQACMMED